MHADRPTLTSAHESVTQAVARLRSLGFKVSTVIGHDAPAGEYLYRVHPPEGITASSLQIATTPHGKTYTSLGGRQVMVSIGRPPAFMSKRNDIDARIVRAVEARQHLEALAQSVEVFGEVGHAYSQEDVIGVRFERSEHEDTVRIVDILLVNGRPVRGGSVNVDMDDTRLSDVVDFHTAPIGE